MHDGDEAGEAAASVAYSLSIVNDQRRLVTLCAFGKTRIKTMLRVLWVATKAPRPTIDGGRLVMATTLDALVAAGAMVTLVAPTIGDAAAAGVEGVQTHLVDVRPRAWWAAGLASLRSGRPISIERHTHAAVADRVADLIQRERFDLVHVEQPQALAGALPARRAGLPCVLRAQNVESTLWHRLRRGGLSRPLFQAEARRMRRFEASALAAADVTIALSGLDAMQLAALDPSARVIVIPPPAVAYAPVPAVPALAGDPAFVWIGSAGWTPNAEAGAWLMTEIWPAMSARFPDARLHVFGHAGPVANGSHGNVIAHEAPRDSSVAFAPESILLLPLRTPAGVRMRLLEAWGRGVPVIASPAAVEGLETAHDEDVLIAAGARAFAACAARLADDPEQRARLIRGGHARLARRHAPPLIARATIDAYHEAIDRHREAPGNHPSIRASA